MRLSYFQGLRWVAIPSLLLSLHASAGIEQQLANCAAIDGKLERLICYDDLAANAANQSTNKTIASPVSTPVPTAAVTVASPMTTEENFGKIYKADPAEINRLDMKVASVSKDPYGALKIRFENGQVWKQNDNRRFKLKQGDTVYIEKGALGSFLLGKQNINTTIRVKRLD